MSPKDEDSLKIGELATSAGVTPETVRYYEREGVIPPASRGHSGYRRYSRADADRLRFIRRARDLGFSLAEVRELLSIAEGDPSRPCEDVNRLALAHIAQVDEKLARLAALRTQLSQLAAACTPEAKVVQCSILSALSE